MDLYDVKARGIRSPLNSREISHLFRAGHLHRRVRCRPKGEASWCTIGELFPLLEYGIGGYSLPLDESEPTLRRRVLKLVAIVVGVIVTAAAAFLIYNRSALDSVHVRAAAKSRSTQATAALVLARNN